MPTGDRLVALAVDNTLPDLVEARISVLAGLVAQSIVDTLPAGLTTQQVQTIANQAAASAASALVGAAPGTLDTLNELATALGNDPNFASSVAASIGAKYTKPGTGIPASDLTAGVQASLVKADASQSAAQVQTLVLTAIDGLVAGAPGALDTLNEIALALASDDTDIAALFTAIGTKASTTALTAETQRATAAEQANTTAIGTKYVKPGAGIPKADLATAVQTSLDKADVAARASSVVATIATDVTPSPGDHVKVDASTASRTVTDAVVTNASRTVTSATAAFTAADVGRPLFALGIPIGATITSVESATSLTSSVNSTTSLTAQNLTIGNATRTVTLPASAPAGSRVSVQKVDASPIPVTVAPGAGDSINGPTTLRPQNASRTYIKGTGTEWDCVEGLTLFASTATAGGAQTRAQGCVVSITGDSISPQRTSPPLTPGLIHGKADQWSTWLHLLSGGRVQIGVIDGIGSTRGDQINARFPRTLEAYPNPHFQVCDASYTNSAGVGVAVSVFMDQLKYQCDMAAAAGATPVVHTGYPIPSTARLKTDQYRRAVLSAAARFGWIVVDTFSALVDPANGNYLTAYDSGDNTHPNTAGKRVIGQTFYDALKPYLLPFTPVPQMLNAAADSGSLLPNGLFLTDTNADGVADGWTKTGTGTYSLVSGDAEIRGNAARVVDTASSGFSQISTGNLSGTTTGRGGHRIAFTGKVRVDGLSGAVNLGCSLSSPTSGKTVTLAPIAAWTGAATDGWRTFHIESIAPADCNGISATINTNGGTGVDFRVAQLRIDDLSV